MTKCVPAAKREGTRQKGRPGVRENFMFDCPMCDFPVLIHYIVFVLFFFLKNYFLHSNCPNRPPFLALGSSFRIIWWKVVSLHLNV